MTRFLYITTFIFLVVGISVSTIYWWPQFWGPESGYWVPWVPWLKIASAVLAALWILRLIIWIKEKREESKFHRDIGKGMNVLPPADFTEPTYQEVESDADWVAPTDFTEPTYQEVESDADWVAPKRGPAFRPKRPKGTEYIVSEPISYIVPEPLSSQSVFEHGADFLTNQRINRLLEKGDITIKEAEATRRQTENMNFLGRESFLSAIEHKAETERQEHDRSPDSILKKYGFDRKKFGL